MKTLITFRLRMFQSVFIRVDMISREFPLKSVIVIVKKRVFHYDFLVIYCFNYEFSTEFIVFHSMSMAMKPCTLKRTKKECNELKFLCHQQWQCYPIVLNESVKSYSLIKCMSLNPRWIKMLMLLMFWPHRPWTTMLKIQVMRKSPFVRLFLIDDYWQRRT